MYQKRKPDLRQNKHKSAPRASASGPQSPGGNHSLTVAALEDMDLSLVEILDHVLNRGLVIAGEITISVANVDLIFLALNVVISSVETIERALEGREKV